MWVGDFVNVPGDKICTGDGAPKAVTEDADLAYVTGHFAHSGHGGAGFDQGGGDGGDADEEDTGGVVEVLVHGP